MGNLRDKYKATSTSKLKNKIQEENAIVGSSDRAGYLKIEEGNNKFRIYPAHDADSGDWYVMVVKHWLTLEDDKGKEIRRTVYNAKQHGGFKKDIFEEYINMSKAHLLSNEDSEATEKIALMTGFKTGLTPSASWVLYASKIKGDSKEFGMLDINKSTRDGLNKIACFEDEDEPISVEPFTDPDEGVPVTIAYNSKAKNNNEKYAVSVGTKPKAMPLTDEELEDFDKVKPLSTMYSNIYTLEDLTLALEGIRYFDEKHEIGLWDTDEWQEKIEEITEMVKSGKSKKKDEKKTSNVFEKKNKELSKNPTKSSKKNEDEEEDDEEEDDTTKNGDKFDDMDRDELKEFISENLSGKFKIMKSDSDDAIREKIREALAEDEEVEDEEEEEEAPAKKPIAKKKIVDEDDEDDDDDGISLEAIKAKIKKNKK